MITLHDVFENVIESDIYQLSGAFDIARIHNITIEKNATLYTCDGTQIRNKTEFFEQLYNEMAPLPFGGFCLDGFYDYMREIAFEDDHNIDMILYTHIDQFAKNDPHDFDKVMEVLLDSVDYRNRMHRMRVTPLLIFLHSESEIDLPILAQWIAS